MQQVWRSTNTGIQEERTALADMPEVRRFYPDAERCTGLTWQALVDQLMGINPPIIRVAGRMVVNIGIGMDDKSKIGKIRTSNFDLIVMHILKEAGSLSTPELYEEILLLGEKYSIESLFRLCKKMEVKGQLTSDRQLRSGGTGRGVMIWQLVKK
jgi:hypothetical protein